MTTLAVCAGWLLHPAWVVQLGALQLGMSASAAIGFLLAGAALLLPSLPALRTVPRRVATVEHGLGWVILVYGLIGLAANLLDRNLGFDFPELHRALAGGSPRPGRMAPHTAIGLACFGLNLVLLRWPQRRSSQLVARAACFGVLLIGVVALFSYSVPLSLVYPDTHMPRMSLVTALCMIVAGIAQCAFWLADDPGRGLQVRPDERVSLVGGLLLVVIALASGLTAFSLLEGELEARLTAALASSFRERQREFREAIEAAMDDARSLARNRALLSLLRERAALPGRAVDDGLPALLALANVTGIAIDHDPLRPGMVLGRFATAPEFDAPLGRTADGLERRLIWQDGLFLRTRVVIQHVDGASDTLVVEQRLPALERLLFDREGLGSTGETGICSMAGERLRCLPQSRHPQVYTTGLRNEADEPLPMARAVQGGTGIYRGSDYRMRQVLSAYGPMGAGLGLVVKQDAEELYSPIRRQMEGMAPVLLLMVALGCVGLHGSLRPLARRLMSSEHAARESALRLRTLVDNVGEGILTVDEDGRILSFNDAATRIFGYEHEAVIGSHITVLFAEEARAGYARTMQWYLHGSGMRSPQRQIEARGRRGDGSEFPLELSASVMADGDKRVLAAIVRDITHRKLAEQAALDVHAELEQRVRERTNALSEANDKLRCEIAVRARAEQALRASQAELRELAAHQQRIKEEERKRIAREIHDELGGLLTGIKSYLSFALDNDEREGREPDRHLADTCRLADSAIDTVRRVITDLRPSVLDQLGLWAAIEWYAGQVEERSGVECALEIHSCAASLEPEPERATAIFRIVQEALTNVVRHAQASRVNLVARVVGGTLTLRIADDGRGFNGAARSHASWGLVGMHERARYFGGELRIQAAPGCGTELNLQIPMENQHA